MGCIANERKPGSVTFDRLFAESEPLVQAGRHVRDRPPVEGGRWGASVVLRPDSTSAARLERAMVEVEGLAGPEHFRTGLAGSVHFTVRVLEPYKKAGDEDEEAAQRYAGAMSKAAEGVGGIDLDLVGLTLAPGSVMACAHPVDGSADRFAELLKDRLGDDGWREDGFKRRIWYTNILHFAADIEQPEALVEWVAQRRKLALGRVTIESAELVRFRYEDGTLRRFMRPKMLASAFIRCPRATAKI
jgi:hypothetical protein